MSNYEDRSIETEMSIRCLIWQHKIKAKRALGFRDFRGFVINDKIAESLLARLKQKTQGEPVSSFLY